MIFRFQILFLYLFLSCSFLSAFSFEYDLDLQTQSGSGTPLVCFHGYGGSGRQLLHLLKKHHATDHPLITFNFPDYDLIQRSHATDSVHFGTIEELLPPLYVIKKCVVDDGILALDLYGFSAGGGALINCLAVLNTDNYDENLMTIGIGPLEKQAILNAIQKGVILLDSPLKSMEEIIAFRGETREFSIVAKLYRENDLRPIDSLKKLSGLHLNIVLFFQSPDEILSNRDDLLFIEALKKGNHKGKTHVLIANQGSHRSYHELLWNAYHQVISND